LNGLRPAPDKLDACSDQELVYWYNFKLIAQKKRLDIDLPDFRRELDKRIEENPDVKNETAAPAVYLGIIELLSADDITKLFGRPTRQEALLGNNKKENGESARDAIAVRAIFRQMRPEANESVSGVLERNAELARRRAFGGDIMSVAVAFRLIFDNLTFGNAPMDADNFKGMMNIQIDKTIKPLLCAG